MTFDFRFALMEEQELDMQRLKKKKVEEEEEKKEVRWNKQLWQKHICGKDCKMCWEDTNLSFSVSEGTTCISGESTSSW